MAGSRVRHSHLIELESDAASRSDDEEESPKLAKRTRNRPKYTEGNSPEEISDNEASANPSETLKLPQSSGIKYNFEKNDVKAEEPEEGKADSDESEDEEPDAAELDDDKEEDYMEDDDEENQISRSRARRSRRSKHAAVVSDDSDFHEDSDISDEDEFVEKLKERNFVASDDENNSEDFGYGDAPPKRKKRRRSRSVSVEPRRTRMTRSKVYSEQENNHELKNSEDDVDSIQKEIEDLYDSSPSQTPVKHKLRERGNKIDYTIPPPISNDMQIGNSPIVPGSRSRGRRPNINKNEYRKLLFPTAGPFGGSDVISLFGTNIPPGGMSLPGMTNTNSLTAIGQNDSDSDSSEDEIAPVNGEASIKTSKNFLIPSKAAPGALIDQKEKKKNSLSDSDPLGVDMNIDFSVVGGLDNYINQLKEMVALPLLYPELYQNFAITPPRGVLFHGPPGTGKTLMARALAASCSSSTRKITFFMRKGADCLSKWVGEAERQLRLLFEEAKNQQPSIIFFDEIDGLAPVRSSKQEQIHASIVSTLLALMDGMDNRGQVIVIGATNRPDSVDPALRRPGRFDREFYFPLPDMSARAKILEIHTRKWHPPLPEEFLKKVAELTKGYGGADLRALCTEAALNSIQRKYPQIYGTSDKLKVDPTKVKVVAKDFMNALDKIVPSSARSSSSGSSPLPDNLKPLLQPLMSEIIKKLDDLLPDAGSKKKKLTTLQEAHYLDPTINDSDGGFGKQQLLKNLENSRVFKPHLLICGGQGNGQQYITSAILNYLEGFQLQSLDMGNIFGDPTKSPELCIVQTFIEARRHQPSVIFIPNIDIWFQVVPSSAKATLTGLLRNLRSNEKILLLGISETNIEDIDPEVKLIFGFNNYSNNVGLRNPSRSQRKEYFETMKKALLMKPFEFVNDLKNRPKRKLKKLKVLVDEVNEPQSLLLKRRLKQQDYEDTKLKNVLKIKLAGLMDLFKNRYKRFKKPLIDDTFLYHLFDPTVIDNPLNNYEVLYERSHDAGHENMIKEIASGKFYYNMDLDIIEERLWNGYYSEPKQFLKDIKLIVKDSITFGDRERILKANEMFTNAQFGVDEFSTPEFIQACKKLRMREIEKQKVLLEERKQLAENLKANQVQNIIVHEGGTGNFLEGTNMNGTADIQVMNNGALLSKGSDNSTLVNEFTQTPLLLESDVANGKKTEETNGTVASSNVKLDDKKELDEERESDTESEAEDEEPLKAVESKELILSDKTDEFFENTLLEITENYNIEKLEIVMAKLIEIIWDDRDKWDKTSTMDKMIYTANMFRSSFSLPI
ncbi:uncharacterized protein PRCAT00000327001 [Priceomyces carsonii]|uniref:uncharacterized protein n=1 Tax=Priceomyces carsonii TaxID=28549 RepID=UPI002EDA038C|nr:unnamed protein product [Priceomyces carsonii]